jgi:hypothetical protein
MAFLAGGGAALGKVAAVAGKGAAAGGGGAEAAAKGAAKAVGQGALAVGEKAGILAEVAPQVTEAGSQAVTQSVPYLQNLAQGGQGMLQTGASEAATVMPQYFQTLSQGGQGALSSMQGAPQMTAGGMQLDYQGLAKKALTQMQNQGSGGSQEQAPPPPIQHAEVQPASGGLGALPVDPQMLMGAQMSDEELLRLRRRFGGGF